MSPLEEHLKERHLDLNLHRPYVDDAEGVVTFFLWNLSGNIVGYQTYRPAGSKKVDNNPKLGKYFTRKTYPSIAVFGVESLHLTPNLVFLTEGIFDAARLTERGYSALAALSNDPKKELRNWLFCLNRKVVAVCDDDSAGKKLARFGDEAVFCESGQDLGNSTDEFVSKLIYKYSR